MMGMIEHTTLCTREMRNQYFISHLYSGQEEDTTHFEGYLGVSLGDRVNNRGLWKAGSVVSRGCGAFWFLQEDVIDLFE